MSSGMAGRGLAAARQDGQRGWCTCGQRDQRRRHGSVLLAICKCDETVRRLAYVAVLVVHALSVVIPSEPWMADARDPCAIRLQSGKRAAA